MPFLSLTTVHIDIYNVLLVSGLEKELQACWPSVALSFWHIGIDTNRSNQYHKRRSLTPMPRLTDVDALCLVLVGLAPMSATEVASGVLLA
jgi:hypothetical protein